MTEDAPLICFTDVAGENVLMENGGFVSIAELSDPECPGLMSEMVCVSDTQEALIEAFRMAMDGVFVFPINRRLLEAMVEGQKQ